ncbi:PA2169 family four-helix-bundle protein [Blastomonas sp.]|uniref:PA2169 family four-helix-bundle protein n=1 Tax=Blastomonas sp. TaxID=1909299 RepID=UPI0035931704
MTSNSNDISTLNSLIATTIDSADGYEEAAKDSESGRFGSIFIERAAERREVMTTLQGEVRRLGGEPEDDGTMLAGAHRVFVNLKSVVTGKDDKAIVNEVERGEDHIKAKYEEAMADTDLSPEVSGVIRECYASVRQGHDQMRDIKHAMEGGR